MAEAYIKPEIITWAIKRSQLTFDALALKVGSERLISWISGEKRPTIRQAQTLAKALHIPFGYLFLSTPPKEQLELPDFRTIDDSLTQNPSTNLIDTISDALRKQQWYKEYLLEEGAEPLPFVGRVSTHDKIEDVAQEIAETIGINEKLRTKARNWEDFLTRATRLCEATGIIVLRNAIVGNNTHRKLSVEEFRGFAISDRLAPLIFLNSQDYKAAMIFTLAHELCHIWIGESGISNPGLDQIQIKNIAETELFCNKVAAELLVPRDIFMSEWNNKDSIENNLYYLVRRYRVSSIVVLRRALDLNKISREEFFESYEREYDKLAAHENRMTSNEDTTGDFYNAFFSRHSRLLSTAIISAANEGRLMFREAANLLQVKVSTLDRIARQLGER